MTAYAVPGPGTSSIFCRAFARGSKGTCAYDAALRPGDVALFGSPALWDLLLQARDEGRTWYYGDHGYFGRRVRYGRIAQNGQWYCRIARGAFQAGARQPLTARQKARAEAVMARQGVHVRPWARQGGHVLVCPPGPVFAGLMARAGVHIDSPADWGAWAVSELAKHTDRPIRVRTKDQAQAGIPLEVDTKDCWAVVTFMSNAALEAVLAGVPAIIMGPAAFQDLGRTRLEDIENPLYHEGRREAALSLAAAQWTVDEIEAGEAWRDLCS